MSSRLREKTRAWLTATLALALMACAVAASAAAIEVNRLLQWTGGATPPLALTALDGKRVTLDDYRGTTVIVNFWATWCVPCREEMPSLAALAKRAPGKLVVLAVDVGEARARVERFRERYPVDLPILLDAHGEAAQAWQVGVYPSSYVVGPDGRISQYIAGALDWDDAAIVRQLRPALDAHAR